MTQNKVKKVMSEFKKGDLHSGSKKGAVVTNPKQAIAIGLSEARKVGQEVAPRKKAKGKMSLMARKMHHVKNLESLRNKKTHERDY